MTMKTKNWYSSVEDHLRIYTPSVGAYLFRGIGTFVVVAVLFPPARFLGAAIVGIAMVVAECIGTAPMGEEWCRKASFSPARRGSAAPRYLYSDGRCGRWLPRSTNEEKIYDLHEAWWDAGSANRNAVLWGRIRIRLRIRFLSGADK